MTSSRTRIAALAAIAAGLVAVAVVWASRGSGGTGAPAGEVITAERGEVALTVGGIGHVTTLTGAARLSVPASAPGAGGSPAGGGGAGSAPAAPSSASSSAGGGGASQVPADAVFPTATGHVERVLVRVGQRVVAGQPVAVVADDGAAAGAVLQARSDLDTARLELAQKGVQDPAHGLPPTPAEVTSGRQAVLAARAKLQRALGPPLPADLAIARADLAKAIADRQTARAGTPAALAAAELGVATAQRKLETLSGHPDAVEVATAQLELAKATLDQQTLLTPASPAAINAADLAIQAAQQKLSDAQASGTASDVANARAELAKAQSDRDALLRGSPPATDAAQTAARLAVDAAQRKLDALLHPAAAAVTAARQDLAKAQADLSSLRSTRSATARASAQAAVSAARGKLQQLLGPPPRDVIPTARLDLRKAQADLAVLRQRGAPASAIDLAIARLKVDVAGQRAGLARRQEANLTVRAPSSGTVTSLLTTRGAAADPTTPMARVQDLGHLVVALDLSEFDIGRTRTGAPARINVDALGGKQFGGHVIDIGLSGIENGGVVNFPVVIALRPGSRLRPGMSVSARIVVASRPDVVRIPVAAVRDSSTVTVRGVKGGLSIRHVRLGLSGAQFVEVRSGLRAGERVVVPSRGG
jgi:macrolide-specific efflux system membrane fusion protein